MFTKETVSKSLSRHVSFIFFVTIRKGSDHFIVEGVTDANIIVAVKKTDRNDGYPTYGTVYYQLNQGKEATCSISHKNQTHDICKIVTHRLATKFTLRFRTCSIHKIWRSYTYGDYSSWQTVWTEPPSKHTPQLIKVNCVVVKGQIL